jgi:hypothetical protein
MEVADNLGILLHEKLTWLPRKLCSILFLAKQIYVKEVAHQGGFLGTKLRSLFWWGKLRPKEHQRTSICFPNLTLTEYHRCHVTDCPVSGRMLVTAWNLLALHRLTLP